MDNATTPEELEERQVLEQAIAEGMADLSACLTLPLEVDSVREFRSEDVHFDGGVWLDHALLIQDWLRLNYRVEFTANYALAGAAFFEAMGFSKHSHLVALEGELAVLTEAGLGELRDRIDRAVTLKDRFLELVDEGTLATASAAWADEWESTVEETVNGPVNATAGTWNISDFADRAMWGSLQLSPSYQRGDVWPTKDAQLLIESILRGIPLPSVIILKPQAGDDAPYEVVDGKQRLTAILRFMGAHPEALRRVAEMDAKFPGHNLKTLFSTDYTKFRTAWTNATGESLSSAKEREYYFPFKLSNNSKALTGSLAPCAGRYYHAIEFVKVRVGGETVEVRQLFKSTTSYKIPNIVYSEATPRQIHEVFSLYNRQGKHLNAEEIRNAVFHEVDLMRALSVAAGDTVDLAGAAPFLLPIEADVQSVRTSLNEYRFGEARYRRTKVLSWVISILLDDCTMDGKPRLLSTSQQINNLLERVQDDAGDHLRRLDVLRDAVALIALAMNAHSSADAWAPKFMDNAQGARWQELQLVGSLLGVALAAAVYGDSIESRLQNVEADLKRLTASNSWKRPTKTQTATQWKYIAFVAVNVAEKLGVSADKAHEVLLARFGHSGASVLAQLRDAYEK